MPGFGRLALAFLPTAWGDAMSPDAEDMLDAILDALNKRLEAEDWVDIGHAIMVLGLSRLSRGAAEAYTFAPFSGARRRTRAKNARWQARLHSPGTGTNGAALH